MPQPDPLRPRPHSSIRRRDLLKGTAAIGLAAGTAGSIGRRTPLTTARSPLSLPAYHAGFNVLIYTTPPDIKDRIADILDRLVDMNVNSVALAISVFQDGVTASEVYRHDAFTPTNQTIRAFADAAHQRGLTVMLRPLLDEKSMLAGGGWRGGIAPADKDRWFSSYRNLITEWAKLAQESQIEMIGVGSELVSMEKEAEQWVRLIDSSREVYEGNLLYSFNWADEASEILTDENSRMLTELDFVGVDAYFPLDAPDGATVGELVTAWQPWLQVLGDLRSVSGKDVLLTEVGVRSVAGAFREPWVWPELAGSGETVSQEDQAAYFEALAGIISYAVVNDEGVRFRAKPSAEGRILREIPEGGEVGVTGPAKERDGIVWWPVVDVITGESGYIGETFLDPVRAFSGAYVWTATYSDFDVDPSTDASFSVFNKLAESVISESFGSAHVRK